MAVGLAALLGFRFPQNFNSPYQSPNISEFWRRWHMSLSFWLRDYLFIPLGGSQGSRARTLRNLVLVMFLGGLWHGAAWTFVVWGLYHGALLVVHGACRERGWVPRSPALATLLTFLAVMLGWVFFRATTLAEAARLLGLMAGLHPGQGGNLALLGSPVVLPLLGGALLLAWFGRNTWEIRPPRSRLGAVMLAVLLVACLLRFAAPSPFLYFQF
jgi:alginate O-acetyltransferase complex protein AlgI